MTTPLSIPTSIQPRRQALRGWLGTPISTATSPVTTTRSSTPTSATALATRSQPPAVWRCPSPPASAFLPSAALRCSPDDADAHEELLSRCGGGPPGYRRPSPSLSLASLSHHHGGRGLL